MHKPFKMWANTDEEAESILNYMKSLGGKWGSPPVYEYNKGGYYFDSYGDGLITYSGRDDREYYEDYRLEEFNFATPVEVVEKSPVVSDGGSSSYYKLTIVNKKGKKLECELGDILRVIVGNDFDLSNIVKACRRAYESSQGRGKDGVSIAYDMNKVKYFADEFKHWHTSENDK